MNPSPWVRENEMRYPSSISEAGKKEGGWGKVLLPPPLFSSGPGRIGRCSPTQGRTVYLPSPPIQMLMSSQNTLTNTPGNNV